MKSTHEEINLFIKSTLDELNMLLNTIPKDPDVYYKYVLQFLLVIVAAVGELIETKKPKSAPFAYSELGWAMRVGRLRYIASFIKSKQEYRASFSETQDHSKFIASHYVAQHLSIALSKSLSELPEYLRDQEVMWSAFEELLFNVLKGKHPDDAKVTIESFQDHLNYAIDNKKLSIKH
jgi:hypothetical protein